MERKKRSENFYHIPHKHAPSTSELFSFVVVTLLPDATPSFHVLHIGYRSG